MTSPKKHILWLFIFIGLTALSTWKINASYTWPYPPVNQLKLTENYIQDLSLLFAGSHRFAADVAYIQLLQYYGKAPGSYRKEDLRVVPEEEHDHDHHEDDPHHGHKRGLLVGFPTGEVIEKGHPRLLEFVYRLMTLDPYFSGPILEGAGVLAFNEKRFDEALKALKEASRLHPTFYRYRLYIGAILYKEEGQDRELLTVLEEAIQYPDCPPLLENILANLLKKFGEYEKAVHVYIHTLETAPQKSDRENAQYWLTDLLQKHPHLVPIVDAKLAS